MDSARDKEGMFDEAMRLRDAGDYVQASQLLQRLISRLAPADDRLLVHSHMQLGHIANMQGRHVDAETFFRAAATASPRTELASLGLFHSLLRLQRRKEALEEAFRFLSQRESLGYRELFEGEAYRNELPVNERAVADEIRTRLALHGAEQRARTSPEVGDTVRIKKSASQDYRPGSLARLRSKVDDLEATVQFSDGEAARVPLAFLDHRDV